MLPNKMIEEEGNKMKSKKNIRVPFLAKSIMASAVAALLLAACGKAEEPAAAKGQDIVIPLSEISETATFYPAEVNGVNLEVLAVKAPDGTIRTAFNTCEVCYDSGRGYYVQEDSRLVCQNCGNHFETSQVEVQSRGCNPWPIFPEDKTVGDKEITITWEFLQESADIFKNWKGNY